MDDLLKPGTYRLPAYQDAWLKKQAERDGHTKKWLAWQYGHSAGLSEVELYFNELVELIKP